MSSAHYIIHRVNLDIEAPDEPTARRVQDEAARMLHHWIIPKLEELLDRLVPREMILRLDRLDLTLDAIDPAGFERDFSDALLSRFAEKIERAVAAASGEPTAEPEEQWQVMTAEERRVAAFFTFLATGRLPWWSERTADQFEEEELIRLLEQRIPAQGGESRRLISLLAARAMTVERLLLQFSPSFTLRLLRLLLMKMEEQREFTALADLVLERLATAVVAQHSPAMVLMIQAIRTLLNRRLNPETPLDSIALTRLHKDLARVLAPQAERNEPGSQPSPADFRTPPQSPEASQPLPTQADEPVETGETEQQGLIVDNAGLVLLHPFIEYYFREFNLLEGSILRDDHSRNLAVHLLHYLATGRETPAEYLLTFEKFFCGMVLQAPVPRAIELTEAMRTESETLLRAAIGHWQALKNTSPAGLREGFLQRPGKLITGTFEHRLVVEGKAHDVLLNALPWGYGIIKLPWLKLPLIVEWVG